MTDDEKGASALSTDGLSTGLRQLAEAYGVATEVEDREGGRREVPARTVRAVLGALGVPAADEEEVAAALEAADLAPWRAVLPPCVVLRAGAGVGVPAHVPEGATLSAGVLLEGGGELALERTEEAGETRTVDEVPTRRVTVLLPDDLPVGWHELVAHIAQGASAREVRVPLAVAPDRLAAPALARGRGWGVSAHLAGVRSRSSWGLGDLADLAELASLFGDLGADFLVTEPLRAGAASVTQSQDDAAPAPHQPVSRRFLDPIHIRPEDVREAAYLTGPQRALIDWAAEEVRGLNTVNNPLDLDAVRSAKLEALAVLHGAPRSPARERSLARFRAEQGQGLEDFALWCALREKHEGRPWPEELTGPRTPAAAQARRELAERIDFHVWLQWIADEQLATAQREARTTGMGLGLVHELAVGLAPRSADAWTLPEVLARGVSVTAPPDGALDPAGHVARVPWQPEALARAGYAPLRDLLRTVLRHVGALRLTDVSALFRQWWVPEGAAPEEGTYVTYDHEALLGVLLLEAHRAGVAVIADDRPLRPRARKRLSKRGVLGSAVLWTEREEDGSPLLPASYREEVLATVGTPDLPPAAGYLADEHIDLRRRLGLLERPVESLRAEARTERDRLVERLRAEGVLPEDPTERQLIEALHVYLARTPAALVGLSLADAVGERRPPHQPGAGRAYPSWRLPLADGAEQAVLVEDLSRHIRLGSLIRAVTAALADGEPDPA